MSVRPTPIGSGGRAAIARRWELMDAELSIPVEAVAELRSICLDLPEAYEEQAWVGTRWRSRGRTFAHVLTIESGWPPAYARAAKTDGPSWVLMFRSSPPELDALRSMGRPFFAPPWRADEVGMILSSEVDWAEIAELLTDSYCLRAPKMLRESAGRPVGPTSGPAANLMARAGYPPAI